MLRKPINQLLINRLQKDSIAINNTLVVDNLTLWYDPKPCFEKSHVINGYSYIEKGGQPVKEWYWEIRRKKKWGETRQENLSSLFAKWLEAQSDSLANLKVRKDIRPIKHINYGRVLKSWCDFILLSDGYIMNVNLTLDFPKDHYKRAIFGSGGIYYRKSSYLQSLGFYAWDQHWLYRLNHLINFRMNSNLRFGLNILNSKKFQKPALQDLFMLNLGLSAAIQYQPINHSGLFFGLGSYLNINALPDIPDKIKTIEPGLLFILGLRLP